MSTISRWIYDEVGPKFQQRLQGALLLHRHRSRLRLHFGLVRAHLYQHPTFLN